MDPSEKQADKSNDVHSLESGDGGPAKAGPDPNEAPKVTTTDGGKTKITDASGDASGGKPLAVAKPSTTRRFWQKFNIYLLLFALVVTIAVGVLTIMVVRSRRTQQVALNPQGLSTETLKQLANTDVTVGDAKQILTVQSNAVFAGSVLVRSNMEIAGTLRVGSSLSLPELSVSGISKFNEVQGVNLTISNNGSIQGSLIVKNGISVSGSSSFTGSVVVGSLTTGALTLNGDLNLTHHVIAGGTTPNVAKGAAVGGSGTVSLSGSDTGGSVVINTGTSPPGSGGCFATITFTQSFSSTPHVIITPVGPGAAGLDIYITRSTTGFVICSTNGAPASQTFGFDYIVFG